VKKLHANNWTNYNLLKNNYNKRIHNVLEKLKGKRGDIIILLSTGFILLTIKVT